MGMIFLIFWIFLALKEKYSDNYDVIKFKILEHWEQMVCCWNGTKTGSLPSFAHRPCTRRCPGTPVCRTLLGPLHISPSSPLCSLEWGHPGRPWVANNYHLKKYIKLFCWAKSNLGLQCKIDFLPLLAHFYRYLLGQF